MVNDLHALRQYWASPTGVAAAQAAAPGLVEYAQTTINSLCNEVEQLRTVHAGMAKEQSLLGKRVRVRLDASVVTEGVLLGFGQGGDFEVLEEDGFVHYCWPMLAIEEIT